MDTGQIEQAIEAALPGARVYLDGEGCNFSAIVISDVFAGLTPVKRQQQVLGAVAGWLATGELHAFSVKTYTGQEWENRESAAGLVQIQLK